LESKPAPLEGVRVRHPRVLGIGWDYALKAGFGVTTLRKLKHAPLV